MIQGVDEMIQFLNLLEHRPVRKREERERIRREEGPRLMR